MKIARWTLAILAWSLVVGVVVQVFLAGVGLFGVSSMRWHIELGYWLPLPPLLMLLTAWPAKVGRLTAGLLALLFVMLIVQSILPGFRHLLAAVAALHPPNALLIFGLSVVAARRTTALARSTLTPDVAIQLPTAATTADPEGRVRLTELPQLTAEGSATSRAGRRSPRPPPTHGGRAG